MGDIWKPFASYEAFYERSNGGWNRDRVTAGVTVPIVKRVVLAALVHLGNNHVRRTTRYGLPAVRTDCQHEIEPTYSLIA